MKALYNLDLQKVKQNNDIAALNSMLEGLVYGFVERSELERYGDDVFIKMVKVLQYTSEYLIYTQEYIGNLCVSVDERYKLLNSKYQSSKQVAQKLKANTQNL
jgi:hypothetical protein